MHSSECIFVFNRELEVLTLLDTERGIIMYVTKNINRLIIDMRGKDENISNGIQWVRRKKLMCNIEVQ